MRRAVIEAVVALIVFGTASADCPHGCPKKCPKPDEFQSDYVKRSFNLDSFWGVYYELAMHDSTQPCYTVLGEHICVYCVRSVKSLNKDGNTYKDLFSLKAFHQVDAICDLEFDITERPGAFMGHWHSSSPFNPGLDNITNTVVDVGVAANGTYNWTLEFQCREGDSGINFAAVNFYHKNPLVDDSELEHMKQRLHASGLGWIMANPSEFHLVNQKSCVDGTTHSPAVDAKPAWCGQGGLAKFTASEEKHLVV